MDGEDVLGKRTLSRSVGSFSITLCYVALLISLVLGARVDADASGGGDGARPDMNPIGMHRFKADESAERLLLQLQQAVPNNSSPSPSAPNDPTDAWRQTVLTALLESLASDGNFQPSMPEANRSHEISGDSNSNAPSWIHWGAFPGAEYQRKLLDWFDLWGRGWGVAGSSTNTIAWRRSYLKQLAQRESQEGIANTSFSRAAPGLLLTLSHRHRLSLLIGSPLITATLDGTDVRRLDCKALDTILTEDVGRRSVPKEKAKNVAEPSAKEGLKTVAAAEEFEFFSWHECRVIVDFASVGKVFVEIRVNPSLSTVKIFANFSSDPYAVVSNLTVEVPIQVIGEMDHLDQVADSTLEASVSAVAVDAPGFRSSFRTQLFRSHGDAGGGTTKQKKSSLEQLYDLEFIASSSKNSIPQDVRFYGYRGRRGGKPAAESASDPEPRHLYRIFTVATQVNDLTPTKGYAEIEFQMNIIPTRFAAGSSLYTLVLEQLRSVSLAANEPAPSLGHLVIPNEVINRMISEQLAQPFLESVKIGSLFGSPLPTSIQAPTSEIERPSLFWSFFLSWLSGDPATTQRGTPQDVHAILTSWYALQERQRGWLCIGTGPGEWAKEADVPSDNLFEALRRFPCHFRTLHIFARSITLLDTVHRHSQSGRERDGDERRAVDGALMILSKILHLGYLTASDRLEQLRRVPVPTVTPQICELGAKAVAPTALSSICGMCSGSGSVARTLLASLEVHCGDIEGFTPTYYQPAYDFERQLFLILRQGVLNSRRRGGDSPQKEDATEATESSCTPAFLQTLKLFDFDEKLKARSELDAASSRVAQTVLPYARFMVSQLSTVIRLNGQNYTAFTETAKAVEGDDWMWIDDNAKSLEMLILPGVYEDPTIRRTADKVLKFVTDMMRTDMILRRVASEPVDQNVLGFKVEQHEPHDFRFHTGLMNYKGNPTAITHSYRFHDGRDQDATRYEWTFSFDCVFADDSTETVILTRDEVKNSFSIQFPPNRKQSNGATAAERVIRIGYEAALKRKGYEQSPFAQVSYQFIVNGSRTPTQRRLTVTPLAQSGASATAALQLKSVSFSLNTAVDANTGYFFTQVCANKNKARDPNQHGAAMDDTAPQTVADCHTIFTDRFEMEKREAFRVSEEQKQRDLHGTVPNWWVTMQMGSIGFSYACYTFLHNRSAFTHVSYDIPWKPDIPVRAIGDSRTHYTCKFPVKETESGGAVVLPCTIVETQLLTAGGLHDEMKRYHNFFADIQAGRDEGNIDYSISYDIGAELNALASMYLYSVKGMYKFGASSAAPADTAHEEEIPMGLKPADLKGIIDRHLDVYEQVFFVQHQFDTFGNIFTRGLGFILSTCNTMLALTGEAKYLRYLVKALEITVKMRISDSSLVRCMGNQAWPSLDCQGGAAFGVARIAATFPFGLSPRRQMQRAEINALLELLLAQGIGVRQNKREGLPRFGLKPDGAEFDRDDFEWSFKCGIVLRALRTTKLAISRHGDLMTWFTAASNMPLLDEQCTSYLNASTAWYEPGHPGGDPTHPVAEIKTSRFSTETNTETQPWAVLGLVADEAEWVMQQLLVASYKESIVTNAETFLEMQGCRSSGEAPTGLSPGQGGTKQINAAELERLAWTGKRRINSLCRALIRVESDLDSAAKSVLSFACKQGQGVESGLDQAHLDPMVMEGRPGFIASNDDKLQSSKAARGKRHGPVLLGPNELSLSTLTLISGLASLVALGLVIAMWRVMRRMTKRPTTTLRRSQNQTATTTAPQVSVGP